MNQKWSKFFEETDKSTYIDPANIQQILSLSRDWCKRVMCLNMAQLNLGNSKLRVLRKRYLKEQQSSFGAQKGSNICFVLKSHRLSRATLSDI